MAKSITKVLETTIREHTIEVFVTSMGLFTATLAEQVYSDSTWEGLRARLLTATRRAKVAVAVEITDVQGKHGVITGVHASTNNLMVRWQGESTSRQEANTSYWLRRLTEQETQELVHLQKTKTDADQALEAFVKPLRINPRKVVEASVEKAVADLAHKEGKQHGI